MIYVLFDYLGAMDSCSLLMCDAFSLRTILMYMQPNKDMVEDIDIIKRDTPAFDQKLSFP
jgi:hypothetical protein